MVSNTLDSPSARQFSMIYGGPGFLTVVWFGSSPPLPPLSIPSVCSAGHTRRYIIKYSRGGGGVGQGAELKICCRTHPGGDFKRRFWMHWPLHSSMLHSLYVWTLFNKLARIRGMNESRKSPHLIVSRIRELCVKIRELDAVQCAFRPAGDKKSVCHLVDFLIWLSDVELLQGLTACFRVRRTATEPRESLCGTLCHSQRQWDDSGRRQVRSLRYRGQKIQPRQVVRWPRGENSHTTHPAMAKKGHRSPRHHHYGLVKGSLSDGGEWSRHPCKRVPQDGEGKPMTAQMCSGPLGGRPLAPTRNWHCNCYKDSMHQRRSFMGNRPFSLLSFFLVLHIFHSLFQPCSNHSTRPPPSRTVYTVQHTSPPFCCANKLESLWEGLSSCSPSTALPSLF